MFHKGPDTRGVCWCVIDSAGPRGSKYHWGVNSPGGLLTSYSSISLFSPHWVNESLCFLSCVLRNNDAPRAKTWGLYSFLFCPCSKVRWHMHVVRSQWESYTDAEQGQTIENRSKEQKPANNKRSCIEERDIESCSGILETSLRWNVECQDFQLTERGRFFFVWLCLSKWFSRSWSPRVSITLSNAFMDGEKKLHKKEMHYSILNVTANKNTTWGKLDSCLLCCLVLNDI